MEKQCNTQVFLSSSQPCFFSDCPSSVEYIYTTVIKTDIDVAHVFPLKVILVGFSEECHV